MWSQGQVHNHCHEEIQAELICRSTGNVLCGPCPIGNDRIHSPWADTRDPFHIFSQPKAPSPYRKIEEVIVLGHPSRNASLRRRDGVGIHLRCLVLESEGADRVGAVLPASIRSFGHRGPVLSPVLDLTEESPQSSPGVHWVRCLPVWLSLPLTQPFSFHFLPEKTSAHKLLFTVFPRDLDL